MLLMQGRSLPSANSPRNAALRVIVPWCQNMATECTQYSAIHRAFLREEFPRTPSVFAELSLRFEDLNIFSSSFDKVDEIDVLPKDGLEQTRALSTKNQKVHTIRNAPHGNCQGLLELGLSSGYDRACTSC